MSNPETDSFPKESPYDKFAASFANTRKGLRWEEVGFLCSRLRERFPRDPKILDLGCGSGRLVDALRETFGEGFSYLGADVSKPLLDIARSEFPDRDFVFGNMANVSEIFANAPVTPPFDAVFAIASFHHLLSRDERARSLRGMAKVLPPGGMLLMTNWDLLSERNLARYGKARDSEGAFEIPFSGTVRKYFGFSPEGLEREVREAGFEEVSVFKTDRNLVLTAKIPDSTE